MPKSTRSSERDYGRYAAGLFAATVVITGGGGVCLMIVFASGPADVWRPLAIIGGGICSLGLILWMLMARPIRRARDSNVYLLHRQGLSDYVETFQPHLRRRSGRHFGTNKPPSADDLRQIKEDSNAWYPSERRAETYRRTLRENNS